jgi:hypothetical protein
MLSHHQPKVTKCNKVLQGFLHQLGFQEWGNADFDGYLMAKRQH